MFGRPRFLARSTFSACASPSLQKSTALLTHRFQISLLGRLGIVHNDSALAQGARNTMACLHKEIVETVTTIKQQKQNKFQRFESTFPLRCDAKLPTNVYTVNQIGE